MAGFREFTAGEPLTATNVDDFLMKQSVMKFADAAARDLALGTAVVSPNALREGMIAYLDDTDDVLKYDGSAWVTVGAAAIGSNVVTVNKVDAFTTTSTTFVDITGMTASITPTTNTSKVLIVCQLSVGGRNDQRMYVNLMRGATNLNQSTGGTDNATISMGTFPNESGIIPVIISFLDSPATTSSTTYKLQIRTTGSSCTVNRSRLDTTAGSTSSITLVEVAA